MAPITESGTPLALDSRAGLISPLSVQDINITLLRLPEKVKFDKSVFMNQGEWELLEVLPQFQKFSLESSNYYAEMKFYVSGTGSGCGYMTDRTTRSSLLGRLQEACEEEPFSQLQGHTHPLELQQNRWGNPAELSLAYAEQAQAWIQRQNVGSVHFLL